MNTKLPTDKAQYKHSRSGKLCAESRCVNVYQFAQPWLWVCPVAMLSKHLQLHISLLLLLRQELLYFIQIDQTQQ